MNIVNNSKNTITVTNNAKLPSLTWDEATFTWNQGEGTWDVPGRGITPESKNNIAITNNAKN
jgi:hypothetical protein